MHCARTGKHPHRPAIPGEGPRRWTRWGLLPGFAGIAVHDAWAPYYNYAACGHQLCCAHAARELRAVAYLNRGQWCWAAQAGEALAAMQRRAADAIAQHRDAIDPAAWPPRSASTAQPP